MNLADRRKTLGMTQEALCARLGISRTALSAIERGKEQPRVALAIRLAAELGVGVEELFGTPEPLAPTSAGTPEFAVWGQVGDAAVLRELPNPQLGGSWLVPNVAPGTRGHPARMDEPAVLVDGCDPILGFVVSQLERRLSRSFCWWSLPNRSSLDNLAQGRSHFALVHVPEGEVPLLPQGWPEPIPLVAWELCIATKPNNPSGISGIADLFGNGVRLAARVPGSGVRALCDSWAAEYGVTLPADGFVSHLEAAAAVRFGDYDATLTMRGTAASLGLDFQPVAIQRSWLAYTSTTESDQVAADALDLIQSRRMRRHLELMPNYLPAA